MKQTLAEEFGIVGIDDPKELRRLGEAKLSELNALDRAAFYMHLGRNLDVVAARGRDTAAGTEPSHAGTYTLVGYAFLTVVAWFVWRPLAPVVAIFGCGNIRYFAIRNAPFWKTSAAVIVGGSYGVVVAILVKLSVTLTAGTAVAQVVFGGLGFLAAGYIGHGARAQPYFLMPGDHNRIVAQTTAVAGYCVVVAVLFFGPVILPGIRDGA